MTATPQEVEKNKFRSIIAGIKEGVVVLDVQQNIRFANEVACTLLGYPLNEMLGKKAADVISLIDSEDKLIDPQLLSPAGGLDFDGVIYQAQNVSLIAKGDVVKVVNIQSRKVANGSVIDLGAMIIIENVYDESELERMKTDFVSLAVHMLRTPLTIIKGYLSTLLHPNTTQKLTKSEVDSLTSAVSGTDQLQMLIENLLHLSEIQKNKFSITTTSINYDGLVATVINEFKPLVEAKGLKLFYVPPLYELPMIKADVTRIKEVLRNLIDNAVKNTEQGGIEVSISKDDKDLHTSIKDTGKGIAQSNLEYIFTKFYRIKDPLSMQSGMGLGLFVSKQIIGSHKGRIWAESIEGTGSVFHFTLPLTIG